MKVGQFRPTFLVPGNTVIFLGVKSVVPSSTLKMRKSHKKLARIYVYTHAYTQIRDGGGRSAPPALIGLIKRVAIMELMGPIFGCSMSVVPTIRSSFLALYLRPGKSVAVCGSRW